MTDHLSVIELDSRFATEREARVRAATTARRTRAGYRRCTQSFVAGTALAAVAGGLVLYGLETDPEGTDQEIARFVAQEFARTGLLLFQGLGWLCRERRVSYVGTKVRRALGPQPYDGGRGTVTVRDTSAGNWL